MISKIADLIKAEIQSLAWVEKAVGMVQPVTTKMKGGETKTIPVYLNSVDLCHASEYWDCVPDSSKMSIIYFEDQGYGVVNAGCRYVDCEATLRLVCWLNLKRINEQYKNTLLMKAQLIRTIPHTLANTDYVTKICLWLDSEEQKSPAIFGKYTYDETDLQYLMYPFDYFALNYRVKFSIPLTECEEITINPDICP